MNYKILGYRWNGCFKFLAKDDFLENAGYAEKHKEMMIQGEKREMIGKKEPRKLTRLRMRTETECGESLDLCQAVI